jgi:hypothetical protein
VIRLIFFLEQFMCALLQAYGFIGSTINSGLYNFVVSSWGFVRRFCICVLYGSCCEVFSLCM